MKVTLFLSSVLLVVASANCAEVSLQDAIERCVVRMDAVSQQNEHILTANVDRLVNLVLAENLVYRGTLVDKDSTLNLKYPMERIEEELGLKKIKEQCAKCSDDFDNMLDDIPECYYEGYQGPEAWDIFAMRPFSMKLTSARQVCKGLIAKVE